MDALKNKFLTALVAGGLMCLASTAPAQNLAGRWYLGLDAGLALQQDITLDNGKARLSFDPGLRLDLSGGVHLSQSWRAEIELGLTYNPSRSVSGESPRSGAPDYFQVPIMANVLYSLPLRGPISVYVGAGVGGVSTMLSKDFLGSEEGFAFGYQGIVGVKYAVNDTVDLGLTYKLMGTLEHDLGSAKADGTLSHSILAALTFKL